MNLLRSGIAVLGAACTKFGERNDRSWEGLAAEAVAGALQDAGLGVDQIEAAWLGCYSPFAGNGKGAVSLADATGLRGIPISRVENYCATGTDAFRQAALSVAAGQYRTVLVAGVEKLKDRGLRGLGWDAPHPYRDAGLSAPACFALPASRYLEHYGFDRTPLAQVAVKNHRHGFLNPLAHLRREYSLDDVLRAPMIASPFGLLDCCPTTDGAAAVILSSSPFPCRPPSSPVWLRGIGLAVNSGRPWNDPRHDFLGFPATRQAAGQAYQMAGIREPLRDIDVAEVHDCFTWTELANYEDLGFCAKGEAPRLVAGGITALGGILPVNPSGGLKSCGHPIGATGVRMIHEITQQLRGTAGAHQVQGARVGLVHNLGGPGSVACVAIFGAD